MSRPLRIEDLIVWKLACEFEAGVIALLRGVPAATRDFRKGYWNDAQLTTWRSIAARLGPALRGLHNSLVAAAKRKKELTGKGSKGGKGVSKVRE